jgi:Ca2+-transporting ATPase
MSPTQTLWINLVASVTLSVPLAFEPLEPGAMRRPPRAADEAVFSGFIILRLILVAAVMTAGACGIFLWEYFRIAAGAPLTMAQHLLALAEAQTICVTAITFSQCFYLLKCRSLRSSLLSQGMFSNPLIYLAIGALLVLQASFIYLPPLQRLFGSAPLDWQGLVDALLVGAVVLPVISVEKWLRSRWR